MKRNFAVAAAILAFLFLTGCNLPRATPTPSPTLPTLASPTLLLSTPTPAIPTNTPAPTATEDLSTDTPAVATPTTGAAAGSSPSGPYAVINVAASDVLYIRSAAGPGYASVGSFAPTATNVMRTGLSSTVGGVLWVQVQNPSGGTGWVNSAFLTEYVAPAVFCADTRVNTFLADFGETLADSDGVALAETVSPTHGMTVRLWRDGRAVTFYANDARWVFTSTYQHNWGAEPGSGLNTIGAFHVSVLPKLLDVFDSSYTLTCNSLGTAPQYGSEPWPYPYTNINYYTVYKPGTAGADLSWRYWLVGVEYVQGQPHVFGLIHFQWEP